MSISHTADRDAATGREASSDGSIQIEVVNGVAVPMPFGPNSPQADAVRGAMRFLSILIAFCDALIEEGARGDGDPAAAPFKGRDVENWKGS